MTTTEAGKKWNETAGWVRYRCNCRLIPLAEKKNIFWDIPADAEKPPLSVAEALHILQCLNEQQTGTNVVIYPHKNKDFFNEMLRYLSDWGFISAIDNYDNLKNVTVTQLGNSFIAHNKKNISKTKNAGISAGTSGVNVQYSQTTCETETA